MQILPKQEKTESKDLAHLILYVHSAKKSQTPNRTVSSLYFAKTVQAKGASSLLGVWPSWGHFSPFFAALAAFSSLILSVLMPASALSRSRICCTSEVDVASFINALSSSLNLPSFSWGRTYLTATTLASVSKSLAVLGSKVSRLTSPSPPKRSLAALRSDCSCSLQRMLA